MPPQLVTLEDAPRIILCPLHVVTSAHSNLVLCFATSDESGSEVRRMLCVRKTPLVPGPRPRMPLLLEIVGQIAADNCYLTVDGHPNTAAADGTAAEDDEREASCWIEARPDVVSRIYWRSVLPTIQTIAEHITGEVDMSNLVTVTPNGSVRLQVIWQPSPGETITSSLPMFNEAGEHQVPATLADVPFNVAVRVVFTLEYHYDREQDGPRTLFASLTRICRV
ncbi:hypothetical protein C8Q70DRAFT_1054633 [Cubamyces menziesii]|nr:hypothetical protein C8Q70DRAFT_1054633 [Cubamyces menziesii]